ncbi:MAG: tetratricopeptide repeat protein [Alphaproteobacteria bacterium]|nr:tetratricopeptide repeat protein [Alphaproteobacteria bacterium]
MFLMLATQALAAPTLAEEAEAAMVEGDAATALKLYRKLVRAEPGDGKAWYGLAGAAHALERWDESQEAWGHAAQLDFRPAFSAYNRGCALARLGRADEALTLVEKGVGYGVLAPEQLRDDPDLASLQSDPRMVALVDRADALAHPCSHDDAYRAVDFWIGSWVVAGPEGKRLGRNTITAEADGCVLREQWSDAMGGTGTSLTWLSPEDHRWHQQWIDDHGRVSAYVGDVDADGTLVMEARSTRADGTALHLRGTWTPGDDGTVHQVFASEQPDGTWWTVFDGTYSPVSDSTASR